MIGDFFTKLDPRDIDDKVKVNIEKGFTLETLREKLIDELNENQRYALKLKFDFTKDPKRSYRRYIEQSLPYEIQGQNLIEQIQHIDKKIKEK